MCCLTPFAHPVALAITLTLFLGLTVLSLVALDFAINSVQLLLSCQSITFEGIDSTTPPTCVGAVEAYERSC